MLPGCWFIRVLFLARAPPTAGQSWATLPCSELRLRSLDRVLIISGQGHTKRPEHHILTALCIIALMPGNTVYGFPHQSGVIFLMQSIFYF